MIHKTVRLDPDVELGREFRRAPCVEDWRHTLPTLSTHDVVLREVRVSDAGSLHAQLTSAEITRFISAPPSTVEGFERFILASQRSREAGAGTCFAVTLRDADVAIGIVQLRQIVASGEGSRLDGATGTAEWGFAIGSAFWGIGLFPQIAAMLIEFAFEHMQVHRLEARCAVKNGRGRRALQKVGAIPEEILHNAFVCGGECLDQVLYAIGEDGWRACCDRARAAGVARVH
jgi:RimJ/RimL family protein N-acetyltransferase